MAQCAAEAQDKDAMAMQAAPPEEIALVAFLLFAFCLVGILLGTWLKKKEARHDAAMDHLEQARLDTGREEQERRFMDKVLHPSQPTYNPLR